VEVRIAAAGAEVPSAAAGAEVPSAVAEAEVPSAVAGAERAAEGEAPQEEQAICAASTTRRRVAALATPANRGTLELALTRNCLSSAARARNFIFIFIFFIFFLGGRLRAGVNEKNWFFIFFSSRSYFFQCFQCSFCLPFAFTKRTKKNS
jgi:hypothetical protein